MKKKKTLSTPQATQEHKYASRTYFRVDGITSLSSPTWEIYPHLDALWVIKCANGILEEKFAIKIVIFSLLEVYNVVNWRTFEVFAARCWFLLCFDARIVVQ